VHLRRNIRPESLAAPVRKRASEPHFPISDFRQLALLTVLIV
jgi:hypothetical protein